MGQLFSDEILAVWRQCLHLVDTDEKTHEQAMEAGVEIAALLSKLKTSPAAGVGILLTLAYAGALNLIGQARVEATLEDRKAAMKIGGRKP
ncbi:MAG: hypothetical protein AB1510_07725 [Bacillota bacterium]